ncbi:DUF7535 family protein [Haloarchaeobius amylolyticus]|uniref:DUF7535 family protein n=1 Tax=Haloarchaeobius amylolyticus TaxID=1198296 RepID=UPI00226F4590|nr:hypothetical protein [Haloarchaeobius amylolyticus]
MATADSEEEQVSTARQALRTVTELPRGRPNRDMSAVGLVMLALLVVVLLPVLPVIALVWLLAKGLESLRPQ